MKIKEKVIVCIFFMLMIISMVYVYYRRKMMLEEYEAIREEIITEEYTIEENSVEEFQEEYFTTKEEVRNYIYTETKNPSGEGIHFSASKEFSEEDLLALCKDLRDFNGSIVECYYGNSRRGGDGAVTESDRVYVDLYYAYSDEKYIYDSIVNSVPLPEDRPELNEVKTACEDFHKEYIHEGMSDFDIELAVHDYIIDSCEFANDNEKTEHAYSAYGVLVDHKAVCEGYAKTAALLLKIEGVDAEIVSGYKSHRDDDEDEKEKNPGHMWNQVYISGTWYNLDTTWDDPDTKYSLDKHYYFNLSDEIFGINHVWNMDEAEPCTLMDMNYFKVKGMYFDNQEDFHAYVDMKIDAGYSQIICYVDNPDLSGDAMDFILGHSEVTSYSISSSCTGKYTWVNIEVE